MITKADIKDGFKFMVDDYEYTVHQLNTDVRYLSQRIQYEGRWVKLNARPNIDVHKDHIEIFSLFGSTILRGRFYYSVMKPVTEPETITT